MWLNVATGNYVGAIKNGIDIGTNNVKHIYDKRERLGDEFEKINEWDNIHDKDGNFKGGEDVDRSFMDVNQNFLMQPMSSSMPPGMVPMMSSGAPMMANPYMMPMYYPYPMAYPMPAPMPGPMPGPQPAAPVQQYII